MSTIDYRPVSRILRQGGVIAYPTDTAYGLGASVGSVKGIRKVFLIKGRKQKNPISIVVSGLKQAREIALFDTQALRLWKKFMPGALTLVLPLKKYLRKRENWSLLSGGTGTIGIRLPKHEVPIKLVRSLGAPITTTSANLSGHPSLYSSTPVVRHLGNRKYRPDIIVGGKKLRKKAISTVVDLSGQEVRILREGSISKQKIIKALK